MLPKRNESLTIEIKKLEKSIQVQHENYQSNLSTLKKRKTKLEWALNEKMKTKEERDGACI